MLLKINPIALYKKSIRLSNYNGYGTINKRF